MRVVASPHVHALRDPMRLRCVTPCAVCALGVGKQLADSWLLLARLHHIPSEANPPICTLMLCMSSWEWRSAVLASITEALHEQPASQCTSAMPMCS